MTQIGNNSYNIPVNNVNTPSIPQPSVATPQVNVSTPNGITPIYQYPTTSIYDPNTKQATSGVNIIINNPSGMGYSNGCCPCPYPYAQFNPSIVNNPSFVNNPPVSNQPLSQQSIVPASQEPIASAPIDDKNVENKDKKDLVQITDEYVKSVENYLRSPDENIRQMGITELIKRFEEDSSRFDHPALNALLNIALQDPTPHNRLMAMSPIATESAHGDANTAAILEGLTKSDKLRGQEAKMAQESLLKVVHTK